MEACCAGLATENCKSGGAPVTLGGGKTSNVAYPKLGCLKGAVDKVREVVAELWA
jgi:hypothetical protein